MRQFLLTKLPALSVMIIAILGMSSVSFETEFKSTTMGTQTLHSFTVKTLGGEDYPLSQLKGKKVLIVNTASECGLTPQYEQLQELYTQFGGDDFEIIGFPCNDFGAQEPGSADQIQSFCKKNYGVTFPMMEKVNVQGAEKHAVYQWLTEKANNGMGDFEVKWNFQKFLIDESGQLMKVFDPQVSPVDEEILKWLK